MTKKISQEIIAVNQANARIINIYCRWVKNKGMNYNEFLIYYTLLENKQTQKQLSLRTHLIKQTVNNIIKQMEAEGYVVFEDNPDAYREKYVVLTEKGNERAHEIADALIEVENKAVKKIGKEKLKQLAEISVLFGDVLEEEMK